MKATQRALSKLLIHTCTITKAGESTGSSSTYGHDDETYAEPETVANLVPCLLQSLSNNELVRMGMEATLVGVYTLFILPKSKPATLTMSAGSYNHQITNVRVKRGNVLIDSGPFDITSISDEGGQGHHYRLMLKRVS